MTPRPSSLIDRPGPTIWEALAGDPTFHFDRHALRLFEADTERWSHRYLRPVARTASRMIVSLVVLVKRLLPFQFSNHDWLDRLGVFFMKHFVSQEGTELLLRHFILETNVLAFIARNAGVSEPTLRPVELSGLGDHAVIVHDVNVYATLTALGGQPLRRANDDHLLDYSMLEVPQIWSRPVRKLMQLDLETGLAFMNIVFCLLTTSDEYRRAVHSLQLDESLLGCVAELTGDEAFRSWRPSGFVPIVRTNRDVPRDLFAHAVIHEYLHARLIAHRDRTTLPG